MNVSEVKIKRILVIEKEKITREVLRAALAEVGADFKVDYAPNLEEAERILKRGDKYDLIISEKFVIGPMSALDIWERCQNHERLLYEARLSDDA